MYKLQIQDLKVKESRFFVIPAFFSVPLQSGLAKQDHSRTSSRHSRESGNPESAFAEDSKVEKLKLILQ